MSLRTQIASLLVAISLVFVATTYAVQALVVMPTFAALERQGAERDVNRCLEALKLELKTLSNITNDWAAWDDSYIYVQDRNETFAKVNLVDEAFSNTHINLLCLLDKDRNILWGESRDMKTLALIDVPEAFEAIQSTSSPLTTHHDIDDFHQGILLTREGPLLLASCPVVTTKREGPIQGSVVMGRFLNESEIEALADRTHTSLEIWSVTATDIPESARRGLKECASSGEKRIKIIDSKTIHAYSMVRDIYGEPAVLIRVNIPRDITAQGNMAAYVATVCSIVGGVFTLLAMWGLLQWRIVRPLQKMAAHATRVGRLDDLRARLQFHRNDEIGTLAVEFDDMVASLADSRKKVLDTAHRAGMAEIASEVLHNVGNAVNSANCSVELLDERISKSKLGSLERATTLLREQAPRAAEFFGQDPRGAKLIEYLSNLNEALVKEQKDNLAEVVRLRETVRHIREAIASQQTFAGRSNFKQDVDLHHLMNEVLQMNQELIRSSEVEVALDIPELPELQLNKSKMTQVLVNLVRNAIQSMLSKPSDDRRLAIAVRMVDQDGLEIEIADTGIGFGDDVRERLFTHGFTTKVDGNGFGLHYCANAIREAGGHITAQSHGVGQGAIFRIRLPEVMTDRLSIAT